MIGAALMAIMALGGCSALNHSDVTGSIPAGARDDAALRREAEVWGQRYQASPDNKMIAIQYAGILRKRSQYVQAVAVLQAVAIKNPKDREILGAYGKALADAGRLDEAASVLPQAHTPENPDWSILSAQGSVADRLGDHASARNYYNAALKIMPGEPSVLSNLGLSYMLTKQLPPAEQALRQAAASPQADARVRQNLAMVLSLEGKYTEAQQLGARDLSPEQAAANVAAIQQMAAQTDSWRELKNLDKPKATVASAPVHSGHSIAMRKISKPDQSTPAPATASAE